MQALRVRKVAAALYGFQAVSAILSSTSVNLTRTGLAWQVASWYTSGHISRTRIPPKVPEKSGVRVENVRRLGPLPVY